ncbi:cytosine/adenosine deaminase-related metal-dependent hydrolase [Jatrophihabitans sp. GAS493]|uniref:amidohydrolase family protein n=1 Tax=Jatrophihabitans sp. GAS493 TaxID=1907575 RepID=UPI000BC09BDB|nr:amidohydrolase family protein [Jatrophihabitans sp. GAS493]SOD72857.1 cytosine/adenosine deaminase-related metal-dependent hydrolase [Jatrophihabitans sp. GAS493]
MASTVIDPAVSTPMALGGRVVTMDADGTVLPEGVVYLRDGAISAILANDAPPPVGFEEVTPVATGGTIFPGLIELHNHLPYGVLGLWDVPKLYGNRDQWSGSSTPDYHQLISGPMGVLGRDESVVPAVVRYVELRCLLAGTTTSQGVALASDSGIVKHFRGLVRNVEATGDPDLPPATTHIADVDAADAEHFLARISGKQKLILHLSEGTDDAARKHFLALEYAKDKWAISANLIGIHCVGLTDADFAIFAAHGGSMVWSPLSNLLLYGKTANVGAAIAHGVPIALGSDWAPSGSKNLLGELKVARLAATGAGATLTGADLVAMVTRTPAQMLGWGEHLGSLESGKRGDLIVVHGTAGDPYDALIEASEADLSLVVINGIPRCGTAPLMKKLGLTGDDETTVGGQRRVLNFAQTTADPSVEAVSVEEMFATLKQALGALGSQVAKAGAPTVEALPRPGRSFLAVDGVIDNHMSSRPHLPYKGVPTGPSSRPTLAAAKPRPLIPLTLDPLTAVDNPAYFDLLTHERNLPELIRTGKLALAAP